MSDPYDLQRFVDAQEPVYAQVCSELRARQKTTHWIWFIFPQLKGLGFSPTAIKFGIASRDEAVAYLGHPILGPRLRECTGIVTGMEGEPIERLFSFPDNLKFHSSMTLFAGVTSDNKDFLVALGKFYGGEMDPATLEQL